MDTSPWDAAKGPGTPNAWADFSKADTFESNTDENWADFTGKMPPEDKETKEAWADFSSFDNMEKR